MKFWAYTLILCSVVTMAIRILIPRGKKSPLYSPLKFLLSLVLIVAVFSPVFSFLKKDFTSEITIPWDSFFSQVDTDSDRILLERCVQRMNEAVKHNFPETEFSLSVTANGDYIPTSIRVKCEDEKKAQEIALFLQANYALITGYERTV